MGLLDDVDDVGPPHGTAPQEEHHDDDKGGEGQGQQVRIGVEHQAHFLRVHHGKAEKLPQNPGQGPAQDGSGGAGAQGNDSQLPVQLPPDLGPGGPQGQEDAGFPGLLPEEEAGGIGSEHSAADDRQGEDHHHLLPAVAPLREDVQNGGGPHHADVGRDEQHGEEAAPRQKGVLLFVPPAHQGIDFGKMSHTKSPFVLKDVCGERAAEGGGPYKGPSVGAGPLAGPFSRNRHASIPRGPFPGPRPKAGPGTSPGPSSPSPALSTPRRPGGSPPGRRRRRRKSRGSP